MYYVSFKGIAVSHRTVSLIIHGGGVLQRNIPERITFKLRITQWVVSHAKSNMPSLVVTRINKIQFSLLCFFYRKGIICAKFQKLKMPHDHTFFVGMISLEYIFKEFSTISHIWDPGKTQSVPALKVLTV